MKRSRIPHFRATKRAGMGSATVMIYMVGIATVGAAMLSLASNVDKFGNRSRAKLQSKTLAETALSKLYDDIRVQMRADSSYPFSLPKSDFQDGNSLIGTYWGRVINAQMNMSDIDSGGTKVRRTEYSFLIEGVGQEPATGILTKVRSRFAGAVEHSLIARTTVSGTSADKISFPMAGLAANDRVVLDNNGGGIDVTSPDNTSGHVVANGGVQWTELDSKKATVADTSLFNVKGQIVVPQSAYDFTVGPNGIGNPNGGKNYTTSGAAATATRAAVAPNSVTKVGNAIRFADNATTDQWKANWLAASKGTSAQQYARGKDAVDNNPVDTDASSGTNGFRVLRAPAYIEGDIDLDALEKLALMPTSSNPAQNVIYVKGNVKVKGTIRNLGVKFVVEGQYDDYPPGTYEVSPTGSPYDTLSKAMNNSALLSLDPSPEAIQFSGTESSAVGLVYAVKGGIAVNSENAEYRGIMVAGGTGENGRIFVRTKDEKGSFRLHFDPDAGRAGDWDPTSAQNIDVSYIPGGVWSPFSADRLTNWIEVR